MPKIVLITRVKGDRYTVFRNFNEDLFRYLRPPRFLAEIKRYDGTYAGALVEVQFHFPVKSLMQVRIAEFDEVKTRFTDQGTILPFGLKTWTHHHQVLPDQTSDTHSLIRDEIFYRSGNTFSDLLFYPVLYLQFFLRKPTYKRYFNSFQREH